jgi:flagellar hook assembly protein FlgD
MSGGLVKSLLNKTESKGEKYVKWDGRNNSGMLVASGIYFFKVKTPTIEETKKMLLLY